MREAGSDFNGAVAADFVHFIEPQPSKDDEPVGIFAIEPAIYPTDNEFTSSLVFERHMGWFHEFEIIVDNVKKVAQKD